MWALIKLIPLQVKAGILVGLLAILLSIGVASYKMGYNKGENISRVEIAKYEGRVKDLTIERDKAQAKVDVRIVTEYKDRVAYVDRIVYKTRTVVENSVPEQFELSKGWIYVYNKSVSGVSDLDATLASNPERSGTSDKSALLAITENNGICLSNQAQLDALQAWIKSTEDARAKVSK